MDKGGKTSLVTGANSGIGFETAAQLAEKGYGKVILVCRTLSKADAARTQREERTGKQVFDTLAADLSEPDSAAAAAAELVKRKEKIDVLILNAGMGTGSEPVRNSAGIELTFASTLVGHHVLTMRLLEDGRLTEHARIIIAGSEGARGDVMMMKVPDFDAFASQHFAGDMEAAFETISRAEPPYEFISNDAYATAKVFVAWWAAALSRKLPGGMTVNAVSPGSVTTTNFPRNQGWLIRRVVMPMFTIFGGAIGMSGPASDAAQRYLDASEFDDHTTGHFYASPPGKVTGPLEIQNTPHLIDETFQDAFWNVMVKISNGVDYPL